MFNKIVHLKGLICLAILWSLPANAKQTENVILISLDGVRWQEVFQGVDRGFLNQDAYIKYKDTHEDFKAEFWHDDPTERRKKLFPFLWNVIGKQGQLYGNREKGSNAEVTNKFHLSYPGYSEILTGYGDPRITSNDKMLNPNQTFLEVLEEKEEFKGRTAAFASWDVFPYIINQERSNVFLNSAFDDMLELNPRIKDLNQIMRDTPSPWDRVRLDVFTYEFAMEYMKEKHPKAVYISYGETDDFAHDGYYDQYILAAKRNDDFIRRMWEFVQNDPVYKDNTTLLITTDHGRGYKTLESWKSHGRIKDEPGNITYYEGDHEIWMAVIGPDTPAIGEMKNVEDVKQSQIAATMMKFLGLDYQGSHESIKAGESINGMIDWTDRKTK